MSLKKSWSRCQAENTVFPLQISNIEWNLYSVKRFLPFVRLYSSWALQSSGILGIFYFLGFRATLNFRKFCGKHVFAEAFANYKYIMIVSKIFLENQAENTVFPFQISNSEWNLYSVLKIYRFN